MAKYHSVVNNYECSINELQRAKQTMPPSNYKELAYINAELSRNYLSYNKPDSSLYYINLALQMVNDSITLYDYYNLKADAFSNWLKMIPPNIISGTRWRAGISLRKLPLFMI